MAPGKIKAPAGHFCLFIVTAQSNTRFDLKDKHRGDIEDLVRKFQAGQPLDEVFKINGYGREQGSAKQGYWEYSFRWMDVRDMWIENS